MDPSPHVKKILLPVDLSPRAASTLRYAVELAHSLGGTAVLELLHVVSHHGLVGQAMDFYVERGTGPTVESEVGTARQLLERMVELTPHHEIKIGIRVENGDAVATIVRIATDEKFDQIILATHGRHGLAGVVFGSVAKAILAQAPCTITVLRIDPS